MADFQLSDLERADIAERVAQNLKQVGISNLIGADEIREIASQVSNSISNGETKVSISDEDIANIVQEVLAELYANSTDTKTLEKVGNLDGITSIPAVRNDDDIVSVPLNLLTTNQPIEVSGQEEIDILVAQGKIIQSQLYFTPADED